MLFSDKELFNKIKVKVIKKKMNFLSIDSTLKQMIFFLKHEKRTYISKYHNTKENNENFINLLINFLDKNNFKLHNIENIFVNQGPGNFSSVRTSISVAKGLKISSKLKLFGYNTFDLLGSTFYNKSLIILIHKEQNNFFIQEFSRNLKKDKNPKIMDLKKINIMKGKELLVFNYNKNKALEFIKRKFLYIDKIHYKNLDFLYEKNLIIKKLIKPLYLS